MKDYCLPDYPPPANELGERIVECLTIIGVSKAELARGIGVSEPTIYSLVGGRATTPSRNKAEEFFARLEALFYQEYTADDTNVEVLPNRYDELNTGNPLPKYEAPPRCARTP